MCTRTFEMKMLLRFSLTGASSPHACAIVLVRGNTEMRKEEKKQTQKTQDKKIRKLVEREKRVCGGAERRRD